MQNVIAVLANGVSIQFDPDLTGSEGTGVADGVLQLKANAFSTTVLPVAFKVVVDEPTTEVPKLEKEHVLAAVQHALAEADFQLMAAGVHFATR